jgi:hypothetical protein
MGYPQENLTLRTFAIPICGVHTEIHKKMCAEKSCVQNISRQKKSTEILRNIIPVKYTGKHGHSQKNPQTAYNSTLPGGKSAQSPER